MNSEVIDLIDPNLSCSNLESAPDERWASVGGLLNGRPIICGGFNGTDSFKDCFFVQGDHDKEISMTQIRSFATAINLKGTRNPASRASKRARLVAMYITVATKYVYRE